jgi:hypothetical protein
LYIFCRKRRDEKKVTDSTLVVSEEQKLHPLETRKPIFYFFKPVIVAGGGRQPEWLKFTGREAI